MLQNEISSGMDGFACGVIRILHMATSNPIPPEIWISHLSTLKIIDLKESLSTSLGFLLA
jgi:hypothetical protein